MFIKWDRFLGKFKKDPPHIGEYIKKHILEEVDHLWFYMYQSARHIRTQYKYKYKNIKYEKYENTSRKNKILLYILIFYIILGSVTSWMNIKYTYIIECKLLLARDRIEPLSDGKSFILGEGAG